MATAQILPSSFPPIWGDYMMPYIVPTGLASIIPAGPSTSTLTCIPLLNLLHYVSSLNCATLKNERFMNTDFNNSLSVIKTFERHAGKKTLWHSFNTDPIKTIQKMKKSVPSSVRATFLPRLERIHLLSAGARRREGPGAVPFVLIGRGRHHRWRLPPSAVPVQRLVGVASGRDRVPAAAVMGGGRGVDAAVVGPALAGQWLRIRVGRIAREEGPASPLTCRPSAVKPALVAVAAGGVAGQRVAAGVAGVVCLALQGGERGSCWVNMQSVQQFRWRAMAGAWPWSVCLGSLCPGRPVWALVSAPLHWLVPWTMTWGRARGALGRKHTHTDTFAGLKQIMLKLHSRQKRIKYLWHI